MKALTSNFCSKEVRQERKVFQSYTLRKFCLECNNNFRPTRRGSWPAEHLWMETSSLAIARKLCTEWHEERLFLFFSFSFFLLFFFK